MMICVKLTVSGMVQGVGFRWFIKQKATKFGLNGTVRNMANGNVEIEVEGEEERVNALIRFAKAGPSFSRVSEVNIEKKTLTNSYKSFEITY